MWKHVFRKTEELIRRIRRARIAQLPISIYKPKIDSRYSESHIVSHNKSEMQSQIVKNAVEEILTLSKNDKVVGIDEAQFFDNSLIKVCKKLASERKRVIVAGLDRDYRGLPFSPMPDIMCEADYLDKLQAICIKCGNHASFTQRTINASEQVLIGETDKYEARCENCFKDPED